MELILNVYPDVKKQRHKGGVSDRPVCPGLHSFTLKFIHSFIFAVVDRSDHCGKTEPVKKGRQRRMVQL